MVASTKDTHSVGVGLGYAAEGGDSYSNCAMASVASSLRPCAIANDWPSCRAFIRRSATRSLREVIAPVFPGYIFVVLNPERDRWRSINGSFGVARLISAHHRAMPVPTGVVEAFAGEHRRIGPGAV